MVFTKIMNNEKPKKYNFKQLSAKLSIPEYQELKDLVGPHVNLASLMRGLIRQFVEEASKKKK